MLNNQVYPNYSLPFSFSHLFSLTLSLPFQHYLTFYISFLVFIISTPKLESVWKSFPERWHRWQIYTFLHLQLIVLLVRWLYNVHTTLNSTLRNIIKCNAKNIMIKTSLCYTNFIQSTDKQNEMCSKIEDCLLSNVLCLFSVCKYYGWTSSLCTHKNEAPWQGNYKSIQSHSSN